MATLTIRQLDDDVRDRLRVRAASNGRSMEAEVRAIIEAAVAPPASEEKGLATRIRARFAGIDLPDIPEPDRSEMPRYAVFD